MRTTLVATAAVVALLPVLHAQPAADMPMGRPAPSDVVFRLPVSAIASVRLPTGGTFTFIDIGEGHVGVGERTPPGRRPLLPLLAGRLGATSLETFMALAPGVQPPQALVADHERIAARTGGPSEPRALAGDPLLASVGASTVDEFDCDPFGANFYDEWHEAYEGLADVVLAAHIHNFAESHWDFYPGSHIYKGTNANSLTFLGVCNGDDQTPLTVEVHRRVKTVTPPTVTYSWHEVLDVALGYNERFTFSSIVPAFYRGRLRGPGAADPVAHIGVGVAYTKTPPLGIGF